MRYYSDKLTTSDLHQALGEVPGLMFREFSELGSPRVRKHGWTVQLQKRGSKVPFIMPTKGCVPAANGIGAATHDDLGFFIAALYRLDYKMVVTSSQARYEGSGDFHAQTGNKYRPKRVRKSGAQYRAARAQREKQEVAA